MRPRFSRPRRCGSRFTINSSAFPLLYCYLLVVKRRVARNCVPPAAYTVRYALREIITLALLISPNTPRESVHAGPLIDARGSDIRHQTDPMGGSRAALQRRSLANAVYQEWIARIIVEFRGRLELHFLVLSCSDDAAFAVGNLPPHAEERTSLPAWRSLRIYVRLCVRYLHSAFSQ